MIKLAPSILAANFAHLESDILMVKEAGAHYLHLDVMDGLFVPNISLGQPVIKSIRPVTDMVFDVHLMIEKPERYIKDFFDAGADIINVHAESTDDIKQVILDIKKFGVRAGVTIKPDTAISEIMSVIENVDLILVMSVEPGFGGQTLIPATLDKIKELKEILKIRNLKAEIEIDGGVGLQNLQTILEHGTDVIVAGSSIFNTPDIARTTRDFLDIIRKFEEAV